MQYPKGRKEEIQRILAGATRCLNPDCDKPLKYAKYEVQAYCCRACLCAYTPTMVYYSRIYAMPFRALLVKLLNEYRYQYRVAEVLGVQKKTICDWVKKFEIRREEWK
jgi:hypothetical protein